MLLAATEGPFWDAAQAEVPEILSSGVETFWLHGLSSPVAGTAGEKVGGSSSSTSQSSDSSLASWTLALGFLLRFSALLRRLNF